MKQYRNNGARSVIFLRLPVELAEALRQQAASERISIVALVIRILQAWATPDQTTTRSEGRPAGQID